MEIIWIYGSSLDAYYVATVEINGERTPIEGTFISVHGCKYDLWVNFRLFAGLNSKEEAMAKGQQIISDLYIHDRGFLKLNRRLTATPFPTPQETTHDIVGWKKARIFGKYIVEHVIVKLGIPKGTRCNLTADKCRAQQAIVVAAYRYNSFDDTLMQPINSETSIYSAFAVMDYIRWTGVDFERAIEALDAGKGAPCSVYKVGDTLTVADFSQSNECCASGIHFFRDLRSAMNYRI